MAHVEIHQFPCLSDNYGVLVRDSVTGLVASIDAPNADQVDAALVEKGWTLTHILTTHHHADHTDGNLALSEYVYSFMLTTAERLWKAHQKRLQIRSNRERRPFLAGVMAGFREKLDEGAREQKSAGLVWIKDGNLDVYFRKRHPRVRNVRYGTSSREAAHGSGREAGRHIVLHKPVGQGPDSGVAGVRLLGAGTK